MKSLRFFVAVAPRNDQHQRSRWQQGFTLIELMTVIAIVALILSVSVPMSYSMYEGYKASIKAQEVMVFVSGLRRDAFVYSERKVLSSQDDVITVDGEGKTFADVRIRIDSPIVFYKNGTTSGGLIHIDAGGRDFTLSVTAPLGELLLSRTGSA